MPFHLISPSGRRRPYSPAELLKHLKPAGADKAASAKLARQLPEIAAEVGLAQLEDSALPRLAQQLRELRPSRLALSLLLQREAPHHPLPPLLERLPGEEHPRPRPELPPRQRSPFYLPWLGIHQQAVALEESNPALAAVMAQLATFTRVVAEDTLAREGAPLFKALAAAGLNATTVGLLKSRLMTGHLPFIPGAVAEAMGQALKQLPEGNPCDEEDAGHALGLALARANGEMVDDGGEPIRDDGRDDPRDRAEAVAFKVVASIDRPRIVSGSTYAGFCLRGAQVIGDDDIEATELTYLGYPQQGYVREDSPENAPMVNPGYRSTINQDDPNGWVENLEPGFSVFTFSFVLVEKNMLPYAAEILGLLDKYKDKIKEGIDKLADKAGTAAAGLATAYGFGGLSKHVDRLTESAVKGALNALFKEVLDLLDGSKFTTAHIVHFVNWVNGREPESIFTLDVQGGGNVLLYDVERSTVSPYSQSMILEENGVPKYAVPGRPHRFLKTSRYMPGASTDPSLPAPADLWRKVCTRRLAVAWANTEAKQGFHAIVPISEIGGNGMYAWSLRADVSPSKWLV